MSPALGAVHDDPGLQPERTTLSWVRTLLVFAADTILFVRISPGPPVAVITVGALCLLFAVATLSATRWQHGLRVSRFSSGAAPPAVTANVVLTLNVVVLSCGAALLLLGDALD